MRTVTATLQFPEDGATLTGTLDAVSPDLGGPVRWRGDAARIAALPTTITGRCDVDTFLAGGEAHADATGAEFAWDAVGEYELMAV